MSFALHEILKNKEIYDRVMKEIDEVMPSSEDSIVSISH
jgi:hypothetical protein